MAGDRLFSRALKVAMLLWMVGWIVKIRFFVWFLGGICFRYPLDFDFFPRWAANPWVAMCAYLLPLSACAVAIVSKSARVWLSGTVIMTIGSATLCFHQNTYNDATFITSMWSGLWMIWMVSRRHIAVEGWAVHAPLLAKALSR